MKTGKLQKMSTQPNYRLNKNIVFIKLLTLSGSFSGVHDTRNVHLHRPIHTAVVFPHKLKSRIPRTGCKIIAFPGIKGRLQF